MEKSLPVAPSKSKNVSFDDFQSTLIKTVTQEGVMSFEHFFFLSLFTHNG